MADDDSFLLLGSDEAPSLGWLIGPGRAPQPRWRRAIAWFRERPSRAALLMAAFVSVGIMVWSVIGRQRADRIVASQLLDPAGVLRIDAPFAPQTLRRLTPEQAVAWNAAAPLETAPNAAIAFLLRSGAPTDYQRSLQCLTMAIYYEAGSEGEAGERAVAQVILNRVRHPAYPKTVCGVVFDGAQRRNACQFTFACDGSLARVPAAEGWRRAMLVGASALSGAVFAPVGWATHYHANYVVPYWAASLAKVATVGAHIFYRFDGAWGTQAAFRGRYAGNEPGIPALPGANALPATEPATDVAAGTPVEVTTRERPVLIDRAAPVAQAGAAVGLNDRRVLLRDPLASAAAVAGSRQPIVAPAD